MLSYLKLFSGLAVFVASARLFAAELGTAATLPIPTGSDAWIEADLAVKKFRLPQGFKMEPFAVEPMLANPVAFCLDEHGRIYVSETHRYRTSVYDVRNYMDWYDDDLACRTLNDRIAMIRKHLGNDASKLEQESEVIRLIEDTDGDGRADRSTVYADGFNSMLDGIASGVLARKGSVYFANIPDVTLLNDANGDGKADSRKALVHGFGVRFSLTGHDLHGLRFGPDGKLYFSVGDRASDITSKEGKHFAYPEEGAVYRCDPDGSNLEVFATGVRNPQELAFDEWGNLFTGDNNCDHGDKARLVYLVEGSDSGWRVGYQFSEQNPAGRWNAEKLWHTRWDGQAAYIMPPIAHIADGPSGFTYYPGTGMPEQFNGHFFLCDFRGQATGSGIHSFGVKPKGGGFEMVDHTQFLWNALLTDTDFGPDGALYMSDWVHGWPKSERGRIYRLYQPDLIKSSLVLETKKLIAEGMEKRSAQDLQKLLRHADMRIRQEAQFELAARGTKSIKILSKTAKADSSLLARVHAIWALGQIAEAKQSKALEVVIPLTKDPEPEIRAQAAKVLGEVRFEGAESALIALLSDSNPRVQHFAGTALARFELSDAVGPAIEVLRRNDNKDLYVRHAGILLLAASHDTNRLEALEHDSSAAVRVAAVVALRRLHSPSVAAFLHDSDLTIVREAARAINDLPIAPALPELAALISKPAEDESIIRRVLNANFRVGTPEGAAAIAAFAANPAPAEKLRAEALLMLSQWAKPSSRDKVTGLWRPLEPREGGAAVAALTPLLPKLFTTAPDSVRAGAAQASEKLMISAAAPALFELVKDTQAKNSVRTEALRALAALKTDNFAEAIKVAQADTSEALRAEANRLQSKAKPNEATPALVKALQSGSILEKRGALEALATVPGSVADEIILQQVSAFESVPDYLKLDVLDAASQRSDERIKKKLDALNADIPKNDLLGEFRYCLQGGNADAGKKIFLERPEASCVRCHKVNGEGGEVGPDLSHVATRQNREYILESIVYPNRKIAPGFESVLLTLKNGTAVAGILKSEAGDTIEVNSPEDGLLKVKKSDVTAREKGLSGMIEGLGAVLSKQDLRNLVEFLGTQK
jgi:quinoprotein glucose dehydrogenase